MVITDTRCWARLTSLLIAAVVIADTSAGQLHHLRLRSRSLGQAHHPHRSHLRLLRLRPRQSPTFAGRLAAPRFGLRVLGPT